MAAELDVAMSVDVRRMFLPTGYAVLPGSSFQRVFFFVRARKAFMSNVQPADVRCATLAFSRSSAMREKVAMAIGVKNGAYDVVTFASRWIFEAAGVPPGNAKS